VPQWRDDSSPWRKRLCSFASPGSLGRRRAGGLHRFIAGNPEAGDLIPETGGVRKIRWARPGSGKRGGAAVTQWRPPLYCDGLREGAAGELTAEEKKAVRKLAAILKS